MMNSSPPSPIYLNGGGDDVEDRATQLRHLAAIGLAATDSTMNVGHLDDAFRSLFEVMARLAEEVSVGIEELRFTLKKGAGPHGL